jgi:type I restriction enzyme S subunit
VSFPRYPAYKDSGEEWLGHVPEHWNVSRLRFTALLNPSKNEVRQLPPETAVTFLPMEAIGEDGSIDLSRERTIADVGEGYTFVRDGDVVLAKITPCFENGKGALMLGLQNGIGFGTTELIVVRPVAQKLSPSFLHYLFTSSLFRQAGESWMYGAGGQKRVPDAFVRDAVVPLPALSEQELIAAFLDRETAKIDALVAEQERLIAMLKEKRQAVISHAVTKGLNPDAPMKDSGVEWLGEVPAHWIVLRLANVLMAIDEEGVSDLPILSVSIHTGVSDGELDEEELERKVSRSDDRSKYKRVAPGDLVYNMMRAWQGAFGTVRSLGMVSPAYVVARPRQTIETFFLELLLRTPSAIEQMRRHSRGVTDFRLRLYWEEFKNIVVAIPPLDEAREICSRVAQIDAEFDGLASACRDAIALLQARRTALITAAVTGQIDVRGLTPAEAA